MAGSTENYDLYIWEVTDEKRETIDQMGNNARKIDAAISGLSDEVNQLDTTVESTTSTVSRLSSDVNGIRSQVTGLNSRIEEFGETVDPIHNREAWKDLPLSGNVTAYGGAYIRPSYRKDPFGMVYIRGLIRFNENVESGNILLTTLPVGYRPSGTVIGVGWVLEGDGEQRPVRIDLRANGEVYARIMNAGPNYLSLESIVPFEGA